MTFKIFYSRNNRPFRLSGINENNIKQLKNKIIKHKLTITEMFNDELTGYEDKISSVSMEIDPEDCECIAYRKCITCKLIEKGVLSEIYPTTPKK